MKNFVVISSLLAMTSLTGCGDGSAQKESKRSSVGATETVIARVDKKSSADGSTAVEFSGSSAQNGQIKNSSDVQSAFLHGEKIVVNPGQNPGHGPGQSPSQKPIGGPAYGPTPVQPLPVVGGKPPVYTPVEPYPGPVVQQPIGGGCGKPIGHPGQGAGPCQPVVDCGCGWDFPVLRAAASIVGIAGQILVNFSQVAIVNGPVGYPHHGDQIVVKPGGPVGPGPVGPVGPGPHQSPNQNSGKHFEQYTPRYKNADGGDINYGYKQKFESEEAFYYVYSK